MKRLLVLSFFVIFSLPGEAATAPSTLAKQPQWLALLQYHRSDWHGRLRSEVDTPDFFLSKQGKHSPLAELEATLQALQSQPELQCRFPARAQWLHREGLLPNLAIDEHHCPELQQWLVKFNASSVSLIFPAAYLNSPSSMFGHLFLRINPKNIDDGNFLLAQTINFAATVNHDDSELVYALRGLFGGYPGTVTVLPYYEKVKEYSELENRDIWEYRLNLNDEEIRRLLLNTWELLPVTFDYYFFDENCAYRILTLLDGARPSLQLADPFTAYAIPSETLRAIVASGLVSEADYRPSMARQLRSKISQLPEPLHAKALTLADPATDAQTVSFDGVGPVWAAGTLEVAYDLQRYQAHQQQLPRDQVARASFRLLQQRNKLAVPSPFSPPPAPAVRDDQGHKTFQVGLSRGENQQMETTLLRLRPAYHDLLDPPAGYPEGAQIKFLETVLAAREGGTVRVEQFTGLNTTSLSPRDDFFQPLSWQVDVGLYRHYLKDGDDPLTPSLEIAAGHSYRFGKQLVYLLPAVQLQHQHELPSNYAASLGLHGGWLSRSDQWQQQIALKLRRSFAGYQHHYHELSWQLSYDLSLNFSLQGELKVTETEGRYFHQHQLGIEWRF